MNTDHAVWEFLGPGSTYAFAESQRGLSAEQETAIFFGEPISEPLPEVTVLYLSKGKVGNAIGSAFGAFIVSSAMEELLKGRVPIQFIPVRLPRRAARDYAILNVLTQVACFDFERSDYDRMPEHPERILGVRRLVLHDIPADAPPLFHIAELPGPILIRADLRTALEELDDGVGEFIHIEDYTWGLA